MEVEELKVLAEKVKIARQEYDKASKAQKEASELKGLLESKMLDALEEADLMRFDAHDVMFLVSNKTSAKTPKSPEEKELFFNYLREQGVYEDMITVNSATLNSYVKTEEALATERGELDFQIPGIAIDYYKQLSVRKK